MKRALICILLFVAAIVQAADEPAVAVHYKQACLLRDKGDFAAAIEEVSKGIALNPLEKEWLAKSELLSAGLYLEMGMNESASVTARQVQMLYPGTGFETKASEILEKINQLTEQSEQSEQSE